MNALNSSTSNTVPQKDYLKILLDYYYPIYFISLFRAHELYSVEPYISLLKDPILDLGCGDGFISKLLFGRQLAYGIDPSPDAIRNADRIKAYGKTFIGDAHNIPLDDCSLGGIFSNCVLEHIPDIEPLIKEISRVLKPGAYFIATALSPFYYSLNPVFSYAEKHGLIGVKNKMIKAENALHNHVSVLYVNEYDEIFRANGMKLEKSRHYITSSEMAMHTCWMGTLSKYIIPYPAFLTHNGLLLRFLYIKYRQSHRTRNIQKFYEKFHDICYKKGDPHDSGIGQILIARKG